MKNRFSHIFLLLTFLVTMICFVTIAVSLISKVDWDNGAFSKDTTGNIGDFLSGTLGVLLSFVSFLLMWKTFATQYRQFERQNELQNQASFETTYFNLLLSLDQVRKEAVIKLEEESKCCSIFKWYQFFIMTANTSKDDMIIGSNDVQSQVEATQGVVAKCYEDFIDDNGYIGFYFRFVYNTIKFAISYWNNYEVSRKYTDLLCAKLSDEELALLFYNAISKYGRDQNEWLHFKDILDKYQIFENLNPDYLIDRSHFRFYPHTDFKFLTRDERKHFLIDHNIIKKYP